MSGLNGVKRPYRIWDAESGTFLVGRNYKHYRNAHNAALIIVRWSRVGQTLEILNVTSGNRMLAQYTRKATTISFMKG